MASEYNSNLIDQLYKLTNWRKADDILKQIEEVIDPVFIRPVQSAYFRFKNESNAHYYVSLLNKIDSREVLDVLLEIISDVEVRPLIFTYTLESFLKYEYFIDGINLKAKVILKQHAEEGLILNESALLKY